MNLFADLIASSERVCTTAVSSQPGGDGDLPTTGIGPMTGLLVAAVVLVVLGLLLRRHGRGRGAAVVALAGLVLGVVVASPPAPAEAAGCRLISTSGVERPQAEGLLPGESATVLVYDVRNVSELPVELDIATQVTSGAELAEQLVVEVIAGQSRGPATTLASGPAGPMLRLAPGEEVTVRYDAVVAETGEPAASTTFDSVLSARTR